METLRLIIPASTSNIGPGFDTLGIAVKLYNELEVERAKRRVGVEFERGVERNFQDRIRRMVRKTVRAFEEVSGREISGVRLLFRNDVPIARGLGSSATFRMGTLEAMNKWTGEPLDRGTLLNIGCKIERHTENCVASVFGGMTASGFINEQVQYARFDISSEMTFVAAVPHRPMSTAETRKILPRRVTLADAVYNLNRTVLLLHALGKGDFHQLGDLLDDKLHQPYRSKVMRPLFAVIEAARQAGAWGAFLSGSGSTIMAIATKKVEKVAQAMKSTLDEKGWPADIHLLEADDQGIHVVNGEE